MGTLAAGVKCETKDQPVTVAGEWEEQRGYVGRREEMASGNLRVLLVRRMVLCDQRTTHLRSPR